MVMREKPSYGCVLLRIFMRGKQCTGKRSETQIVDKRRVLDATIYARGLDATEPYPLTASENRSVERWLIKEFVSNPQL
jgi:hypothetical protein